MSDDLLFSESWHLVAPQRPALRPDVPVHRQAFRGEVWHVLGDPYQNRWFRVRPAAWRFVVRLDGLRSVEEAWQLCLDGDPENTPGQQEVVQLLAQLYGAGLLRSDLPPDGAALFRRLQGRRTQERWSQVMNFLFLRIPLWDPHRFLVRLTPLIRGVFSSWSLWLWLLVLVGGTVCVLGNMARFADQSRNVLAPDNLAWLYLTWTVMKICHELAHAMAVRRRGGEVHVLGVMLLVFTPMPFVDASAAWSFRERRDRLLVGAAGMMSDLAFAAVAAIVWWATGQGLVNSLAHNVIFIGSVSTLLFNANPLLRFDGYYLLADWLDQPNLQQRATAQLRATLEKRAFGRRDVRAVGRTPRETFWLGAFGAASAVYRLFVLLMIVTFVASQWFGVGFLIAGVGLVLWVVVPSVRFLAFVLRAPAIARCRRRALVVTFGSLAAATAFATLVPFPHWFRAPGVVRARESRAVIAETSGSVLRVLVPSGERVAAGQPLIELSNRELELAIQRGQAARAEIETRANWAREAQPSLLEPLRQRAITAQRHLEELQARKTALTVRAPHTGVWVSPYAGDYAGVWVPRGGELGSVADDSGFFFCSVVPQSAASELFRDQLRGAEVWLPGASGSPYRGSAIEVVPAERNRLPSASLGWLAGGGVRVKDEASGRETAEPFFEVRVQLPADASLLHLRAGEARFTLPWEPLARQGWRALRQLLQEKYQL